MMVDMSGNQEVLSTVQNQLKVDLLKCLTVGMTHWDKRESANEAHAKTELQDRTEFFFAPAHIQKRIRDWGHEGYAEKTTLIAKGKADRFNSIYEEYRKAKDITRERIMLETMETIMPKVNKVIADEQVGKNMLPFLPLNEFRKAAIKPADKTKDIALGLTILGTVSVAAYR